MRTRVYYIVRTCAVAICIGMAGYWVGGQFADNVIQACTPPEPMLQRDFSTPVRGAVQPAQTQSAAAENITG